MRVVPGMENWEARLLGPGACWPASPACGMEVLPFMSALFLSRGPHLQTSLPVSVTLIGDEEAFGCGCGELLVLYTPW